jgi:hypothetical protein
MSLRQSFERSNKNKGSISQYRKRHGLVGISIRRAQRIKSDEAARLRNALAYAWKEEWNNAPTEDCEHWFEHPIFRKWDGTRRYYANHEKNKEIGREKAKAIWLKRRNNDEWMQKRRAASRKYRAENKEKFSAMNKRWRENNPDKWKDCKRAQRNRQKADPVWRAMRNIRKRVREVLKGKRAARSTVGCSRNEFMRHIESKFTNGMHWNNYGTYWHLDHVLPLSHFDLSDSYQAKMANHWTNLQPLEAEKNIEKSNTIQGSVQCCLPL